MSLLRPVSYGIFVIKPSTNKYRYMFVYAQLNGSMLVDLCNHYLTVIWDNFTTLVLWLYSTWNCLRLLWLDLVKWSLPSLLIMHTQKLINIMSSVCWWLECDIYDKCRINNTVILCNTSVNENFVLVNFIIFFFSCSIIWTLLIYFLSEYVKKNIFSYMRLGKMVLVICVQNQQVSISLHVKVLYITGSA